MAVAESNVGFFGMTKMAVGIINRVIHIIPFFKHRIIVGSGCLKVVYLGGVRKQSYLCWLFDSIAIYRRQAGAGGEVIIVTITEHHIGSFQFELRPRGVECRVKPDITAIEIVK